MAKKATVQKLASLWNTMAGSDHALAVDFRPLKAPVAVRVEHPGEMEFARQRAKARVIRVDCYLG